MVRAPRCIFPARFACKVMRRLESKTLSLRAILFLPMACPSLSRSKIFLHAFSSILSNLPRWTVSPSESKALRAENHSSSKARGTTLRILVSDADLLNRASRGFAFAGAGSGPTGLDQLIALLNRERRNDRLYVGLFVPAPTLLWDDKELPNIPLSQINVVDGRPTPGSVQVLRESLASEASIPLGGPVSGVISLNLQVR